MRKVAVIASASGNGKTTLGRRLAYVLDVQFVELDQLVHGANWQETSDDDLRRQLDPILAGDGWVIDGDYQRKLGGLVTDAADTVVWLDLPIRIWFPRLLARSYRRMRGREPLWNGNRETLSGLFWGGDSLFGYALRMHFRRRREWPSMLAGRPVTRLRSRGEVQRFLGSLQASPTKGDAPTGSTQPSRPQ